MTLWLTGNVIAKRKINDMTIFPFFFGGSASVPTDQTAYPSGATYDKLALDTRVLSLDSIDTEPTWTYKLEAILAVQGGATVSLALVNLTDGAPDTPMVTITSVSATGQKVQSGAITWPASGAVKDFGVKVKTSVAANLAWAWGIAIIRA